MQLPPVFNLHRIRLFRPSTSLSTGTCQRAGIPFKLDQTLPELRQERHDLLPRSVPSVLAATPRNLAIAYNLTGPEAVGGAPNVYCLPPPLQAGAVQASVTASLGKGMYVGNLVVPPSAVTSPIQLAAAEAPLVATTAEGAPLIPMFVPPMPPGARQGPAG